MENNSVIVNYDSRAITRVKVSIALEQIIRMGILETIQDNKSFGIEDESLFDIKIPLVHLSEECMEFLKDKPYTLYRDIDTMGLMGYRFDFENYDDALKFKLWI
jgi:hypothetical protein